MGIDRQQIFPDEQGQRRPVDDVAALTGSGLDSGLLALELGTDVLADVWLGVGNAMRILIKIAVLLAILLGWGNPVWAMGEQAVLGNRYISADGYMTLSFAGTPLEWAAAVPLRGQFVNQAPGEHWVGELQLNPRLPTTAPDHRRGQFRDVAPESDPAVVCTGEVDLQTISRAQAIERIALAFKITGGEHCEALLGDSYRVDFIAAAASD
jgi:hypothetical protein